MLSGRTTPSRRSTRRTRLARARSFPAGDYSCVKDNAIWQWDRNAISDFSSAPGCYRMVNGAERHLVGRWPSRDITAAAKPGDPCSGFNSGGSLDPAPGRGAPPNQ